MADDILDLIDHAIADDGWDVSDDAMRWAPTVTKDTLERWAENLRAEFAAFAEALQAIVWPPLRDAIRHVSVVVNQEPLRTLLAERLRHERRMSMWRRKARATWPRWKR